jgi:hypothetical protein
MLDPQTRYYAVTGESIVEKSVCKVGLVGSGAARNQLALNDRDY